MAKHFAKLSSDNVGDRPSVYSAFMIVSVTYFVQMTLTFKNLKQHISMISVSVDQESECGLPGASEKALLQGCN